MNKTSGAKLGMHILEIEITSRCNLNCQHCYNRQQQNFDLPLKQIKGLYRFAEKNNVWTFIISGGEALLHPEFDKLLSFIKKTPHQFRLILQINGLLINGEITEKIKVFDLIHISFDVVAGIRFGAEKNLALAKKLLSRGVKCYLFVTLHKKNKNALGRMVRLANQNGVPIGFNICLPTEKLGQDFIMSQKEFETTERKLYKFSQKKQILRYSSPLTSILDKNKAGPWQGIRGGCTAGIGACVVDPHGEVLPCPFLRISAGNINQKPLKTIWLKSELLNKIRNRKKFAAPCGKCQFLSYCGGCRNRALRAFGNIQGSDPMCYY